MPSYWPLRYLRLFWHLAHGECLHCWLVIECAVQYPKLKHALKKGAHLIAGLRHVAHALLAGADAKQQSALEAVAVGEAESMNGDAGVASAKYIRDRGGGPRDLPFPAARQLRAH